MQPRIEDYALLSDTQTAALVHRDGTVEWLCFPRFDSDACFASLLGARDAHGSWTLTAACDVTATTRAYRGETMILETTLDCAQGRARIIDFMPPRGEAADLVRIVVGERGEVSMRTRIAPRFGYGAATPWIRPCARGATFTAGADALRLESDVEIGISDAAAEATWTVTAGARHAFVLTSYPSFRAVPRSVDADTALRETEQFWSEWAARCTYRGPYRDAVMRSLLTLKALTYAPSGGIVAAPTASLPEQLGGVRNWDYRFAWLRDATFTLNALFNAGYRDEALAWRGWLQRACAGDPAEMQTLYGVGGERRIPEYTIEWLPGFAGSRPVRIGNAAVQQFQLDIYGEIMDCLHQSRRHGIPPNADVWRLERELMRFVATHWDQPDEGIWEVRGGRRHFTHSKVMAWVAVDRAVAGAEGFGLDGPVDEWRALRQRIHDDICAHAFDARRGAFMQSYDSDALDASVLLIPLVGFLPSSDARVVGTVAAIERELLRDGLVLRYDSATTADGLPAGEGAFLACSFWLVDNYALAGRDRDARALFEHLLALSNDVGLLAEEYDPRATRQLGNFPQAFSHLALVNSAINLAARDAAAHLRRG